MFLILFLSNNTESHSWALS